MAALAAALVLGSVVLAVAQPGGEVPRPRLGGIEFEHFTVEQGLPNAAVTAVAQDSLGFIWIGTLDGLVRYDGVNTLGFRRSSDEATLPSNVVQALVPARGGGVWIGTAGGLARFDARTETVRRVDGLPAPDVRALAPDGRGGVWVGTEAGLAHVGADGAVGAVPGVPATAVEALHPAPDGDLWVGTADGLLRRDAETGRVRLVRTAEGRTPAVSAVAGRGRGGVWVGTLGAGLFAADPAGRLVPVDVGPGLFAADVTSVYEDAEGGVWVGTMGGGLRRVGLDGEVAVYTAALDDPASLASDEVTDLFEDRQGILWVATYDGLDRFDRARDTAAHIRHDDRRPTSLASNTVLSVLATSSGALYVGTGRTLDRTTDGRTFAHLPVPASGVRNGTQVTVLYQDRAGTVWAGTRGAGLLRVAGDELDPAPLTSPTGTPAVTALLETRDGRFWVGTAARGLAVYDRDTGEAQFFQPGRGAPGRGGAGTPGARIRSLAETEAGVLWVGTEAGLCRFDGAGSFSCLDAFAGETVYALHADGRTLWVGTDAGLARLAGATASQGDVTRYTAEATDLAGGDVFAVVPDDTGTLWLATSGGIARFEPVTETFAPRLGGGAAGRIPSTAAARGPDGRLYFGGTRGLLAFDPQSLRPLNVAPPEVVITGVDVAGQPAVPGGEVLDAAAPLAERVTLGPDQDYLTIYYAGLHFSAPERNTYRVRLDGLDDDWRPVGTAREATFSTLPSGTYTFEVQAANADGVWSTQTASIGVVVRPPWWRTWWALLGFAAVAVAGLVRADRWQRTRLLQRERERAERREAELRAETAEAEHRKAQAELERAREVREANAKLEAANERLEASIRDLRDTQAQLVQSEKLASLGQLTAGIAHEIKNPLNFVNNFADLSVDLAAELREEIAEAADRPARDLLPEIDPLLDDLADNARRIHEHGQRADRIVRAMLLHSRGGSEERARAWP